MFSSEHVIQNRESTSWVSVSEFLLALLIMCTMPSAVMWTKGISKARTLAPSVSLLIGQIMSCNLLYLKSLLNPMVYARRLTKYRQAFYMIQKFLFRSSFFSSCYPVVVEGKRGGGGGGLVDKHAL